MKYQDMSPLELAQARAREWYCPRCQIEAAVFTDLPGAWPYVRCPGDAAHGGDHPLERRRKVDDGHHEFYRAPTEDRKARDVTEALPKTRAEWELAWKDLSN